VTVTRKNTLMGDVLKTRRQHVTRSEIGLPPVAGRQCGLRREEVAYLAGVSVTWYTWLEQGRDVTPSRQVLDAVARTLRLSAAEHLYVLSLAGYSAPEPGAGYPSHSVPDHVARLLDGLADCPSYAIASDWTIAAWNTAYSLLYPNVATVATADRNLLWLLFTDPYLRALIPDWEFTSAHHVASFRAQAGARLGDPPLSLVVDRLLEASAAFRTAWEGNDLETLTNRQRLFRHPVVGDLHMEQHSLVLADHPCLHVVVFTPVSGTDTPARLRNLLEARET
jgi:transcriptional regulator with XRE-family HTH domain